MKSMYISLIIIGLLLAVIGIVGIVKDKEDAPTSQPQIVERIIEHEVRVDTVTLIKPSPAVSSVPSTHSISAKSVPKKTDNKPLSNKDKGNLFENFVANLFTNRDVFTVMEWNQGVTSSEGVYAENNVNPDFKISHKFSSTFDCKYWVECKYQSRIGEDALTFNDYQIKRYRDIQRNSRQKVIMAVGVGGTPDAPAAFYAIPLDSVSVNSVSIDKLSQFCLSNPRHNFAPYIKNYFEVKVFPKSRQRKRISQS